jgi:hypothetical protein
MRRLLLAALLLCPVPVLADDPPQPPRPTKGGPALAVGQDLPGPFHPFCVSGPYIAKLQQARENQRIQGRFHCPVSAHGLDAMVLLFVKNARFRDPPKELTDLLVRLNAAVEKNPQARLAVTAVFVSDDLGDVVAQDKEREELADQLRSLAGTLKLANVSLCLDSKSDSDLQKYELDREEAAYTVVLARRYRVVAAESLARDRLTPEAVDRVMKQVAEKLGATRQ